MKTVISLIFGTQVFLGSICLMNVAYAAEPMPLVRAHESVQGGHALACEAATCQDETGMTEHDAHSGCMSGDCYTAAYPTSVGPAGETNIQEMPASLSPLLTQVLLVLGPSVIERSYGHGPPLSQRPNDMIVLRE